VSISCERRKHTPRLRSQLNAQIVLPLQKNINCVVTEISPAGARLNVDLHQALPSVLAIQLCGDETLFYCDLVWRKGRDVGLTISADQWRFWWIRSQAFSRQLHGVPAGLGSDKSTLEA
jgi:hypothetical protein